MTEAGPELSRSDQGARPAVRRGLSVIGVIGELFITVGVLVLLFFGWQLWLNDIIVGAEHREAARELSESWQGETEVGPAPTPDTDVEAELVAPADPVAPAPPAEPVVGVAPANARAFGNLIVPRFGADFYRPIAEGIGVRDVLNVTGIGHYPTSAMPGAVGNFAIAAHRKAYGAAFERLHELRLGDDLFVETADGWYQYTFRNIEYVRPSGVGVIDEVPQREGVAPTDRVITLTTCNPFFSTAERLIAYGVFEAWHPRAAGVPAEIARTVEAEG